MPYLQRRQRALEGELRHLGIMSPAALREHMLRRSGRSTAFAMMTIAQALTFPGQPIPLRDHYMNERYVVRLVQIPLISDIIQKQGLEGLTLNHRDLTLTYTL